MIPLLVAATVAAAAFAYSLYNKPHKDYSKEEVTKSWTANELTTWFATHSEAEHAQWQDQVVVVEGVISSASDAGAILESGVVVTWEENKNPGTEIQGLVSVKGRILGFDDLFGEVRLDHAELLH